MTAYSLGRRTEDQAVTILEKLLGSLELEVIDFMWQAEEATVRQVTEAINRKRPIVYTTVMTVMGHLMNKGLLARTMEVKRYRYRVVRSRDEFLCEASKRMVRTLLDDFGDLAIKEFLGEISKVDAGRLEYHRRLVQEVSGGSNTSE